MVLECSRIAPKVDELLAANTSDNLCFRMICHHMLDDVFRKISGVGAQLTGVLGHEVIVPQVAELRLLAGFRDLWTKLTLSQWLLLPHRIKHVWFVVSFTSSLFQK